MLYNSATSNRLLEFTPVYTEIGIRLSNYNIKNLEKIDIYQEKSAQFMVYSIKRKEARTRINKSQNIY